jgi:hypothetical protein
MESLNAFKNTVEGLKASKDLDPNGIAAAISTLSQDRLALLAEVSPEMVNAVAPEINTTADAAIKETLIKKLNKDEEMARQVHIDGLFEHELSFTRKVQKGEATDKDFSEWLTHHKERVHQYVINHPGLSEAEIDRLLKVPYDNILTAWVTAKEVRDRRTINGLIQQYGETSPRVIAAVKEYNRLWSDFDKISDITPSEALGRSVLDGANKDKPLEFAIENDRWWYGRPKINARKFNLGLDDGETTGVDKKDRNQYQLVLESGDILFGGLTAKYTNHPLYKGGRETHNDWFTGVVNQYIWSESRGSDAQVNKGERWVHDMGAAALAMMDLVQLTSSGAVDFYRGAGSDLNVEHPEVSKSYRKFADNYIGHTSAVVDKSLSPDEWFDSVFTNVTKDPELRLTGVYSKAVGTLRENTAWNTTDLPNPWDPEFQDLSADDKNKVTSLHTLAMRDELEYHLTDRLSRKIDRTNAVFSDQQNVRVNAISQQDADTLAAELLAERDPFKRATLGYVVMGVISDLFPNQEHLTYSKMGSVGVALSAITQQGYTIANSGGDAKEIALHNAHLFYSLGSSLSAMDATGEGGTGGTVETFSTSIAVNAMKAPDSDPWFGNNDITDARKALHIGENGSLNILSFVADRADDANEFRKHLTGRFADSLGGTKENFVHQVYMGHLNREVLKGGTPEEMAERAADLTVRDLKPLPQSVQIALTPEDPVIGPDTAHGRTIDLHGGQGFKYSQKVMPYYAVNVETGQRVKDGDGNFIIKDPGGDRQVTGLQNLDISKWPGRIYDALTEEDQWAVDGETGKTVRVRYEFGNRAGDKVSAVEQNPGRKDDYPRVYIDAPLSLQHSPEWSEIGKGFSAEAIADAKAIPLLTAQGLVDNIAKLHPVFTKDPTTGEVSAYYRAEMASGEILTKAGGQEEIRIPVDSKHWHTARAVPVDESQKRENLAELNARRALESEDPTSIRARVKNLPKRLPELMKKAKATSNFDLLPTN